ncbi:MAG: electron transfer flavoprotein subunit beta/FixA family protein [Anaerolineae bacterium]|jgi:electron transfer flavoprotein beta subunit|nr:electron transfer flavoprotein subunit beta/FixA family protein [Anaerolineae bacterium]
MRIIVPIKQVPETSKVKMDPETGTMLRKGLASIVNPLDLYAIEAALRLREKHGGTVTAISMGPQNAVFALREAIALGCDDAVLLSDRKFAGADTWATSYVLSKAIQKLGEFDLILCGERATDGDTGQVGPGIAAWLDIPMSTFVRKIREVDEERIRFERLVEEGIEVLSTPMPALLTVIKEVDSPRMPTLKQKLQSLKTDIPIWGPDDIAAEPDNLGLNGSPTRVVKIEQPKVTRKAEMVYALKVDEAGPAARKVVDFLKERGVL